MITTSLDTLVRGVLLKRGLSLHSYLSCLLAASRALFELGVDDMKTVNNVKLPISEINTCTLPFDYIDFCKVTLVNNQPLVEDNSISSISNYDESFTSEIAETFDGETHSNKYSFKIIKERNEMQLHKQLCEDFVVLSYISDGRNADAASHIHTYAENCIISYIDWQLVENSSSYSMGEKERMRQLYINERKILRARMSDLTIDKLRSIVSRGFRQQVLSLT